MLGPGCVQMGPTANCRVQLCAAAQPLLRARLRPRSSPPLAQAPLQKRKPLCVPQKRATAHFSPGRMTTGLGSGRGPRTEQELSADVRPENPYAFIMDVLWPKSLSCHWLNLSELVFS